MTSRRIVVLGASGFVGTTLVERMCSRGGWDVVPVIHSAGSAWRLARHGRSLVQVDIGDRSALREVLKGATHVVNCTRGGRDVMIDGYANILAECRAAGVSRLVHLSSVMVYGDPPAASSAKENGPADDRQDPASYGGMKLEQDSMTKEAVRRGLRSVVLCPPNISGPFSLYLCGIVDGLRKGTFGLVGEGNGPCNLVDVRTLCAAIESALAAAPEVANGERLFVTDGGGITWASVVAELRELAEVDEIRFIDRETLQRRVQAQVPPKARLSRALVHLVSSDVREALRKDPMLARLDKVARRSVALMGSRVEGRLRRSIEGTTPVPRIDALAGLQIGLCAQQLRDVEHCNNRIREVLGFVPPIDFKTSMSDFRRWYATMFGVDRAAWPLARRLFMS